MRSWLRRSPRGRRGSAAGRTVTPIGPRAAVVAVLLTGCATIERLDGTTVTTAAAVASPAALTVISRPLTDDGVGRTCDNHSASCQITLQPGDLPRRAYSYDLRPGDSWWGTVERQQQCADPAGALHGEAVKATVHATIVSADAAGNLQMEATVIDVIVSDGAVDPTTVQEFPLGARTSALFTDQGLAVRPLQPPTYAAALISPVPPGEVGMGARWEIRPPGSDTTGIRQLQLVADGPDGFTIEGVTGDWLDRTHETQRVTSATTVSRTLRSVGPRSRAIEVTAGVACFSGSPSGPVRYFVSETAAPDLDGDGSPG